MLTNIQIEVMEKLQQFKKLVRYSEGFWGIPNSDFKIDDVPMCRYDVKTLRALSKMGYVHLDEESKECIIIKEYLGITINPEYIIKYKPQTYNEKKQLLKSIEGLKIKLIKYSEIKKYKTANKKVCRWNNLNIFNTPLIVANKSFNQDFKYLHLSKVDDFTSACGIFNDYIFLKDNKLFLIEDNRELREIIKIFEFEIL